MNQRKVVVDGVRVVAKDGAQGNNKRGRAVEKPKPKEFTIRSFSEIMQEKRGADDGATPTPEEGSDVAQDPAAAEPNSKKAKLDGEGTPVFQLNQKVVAQWSDSDQW